MDIQTDPMRLLMALLQFLGYNGGDMLYRRVLASLAFFLILGGVICTGCASVPSLNILSETTPPEMPSPTLSPSPSPTAEPIPVAGQVKADLVSLRIWLPPEFNPGGDNPAGTLLQSRLSEFQQQRDMRVEIRIKGLEGEGGMINALTTANAVAPLALPDVVLMSRAMLEKAALKGLLYPFDSSSGIIIDEDWFDYTRQLAEIQGSTYGIPFAGDALILVYRAKNIGKPPRTWDSVLTSRFTIIFPAADAEAKIPVAQYLASGGVLQDAEGKPNLDLAVLTTVFSIFERAQKGEQMPYWLTQYETDDQAWKAYLDNRAPAVFTWLSNYLHTLPQDSEATLMPTISGNDYTLMRGWNWVLTSTDPTRRSAASELVRFMTESEFSAHWTETAGYLPVQVSALKIWENGKIKALGERITASAHAFPPSDILGIVSPIFKDQIVRMLKNQSDATTAAQDAIEKLKTP